MITALSSITYGVFYVVRTQNENNVILSSCFSTSMTKEPSSITLEQALPISDEEGMKTTPYTFTINNTCNLTAKYYVILSSTTESFSNNYVSYRYNKKEARVLGEAQTNTLGVDSGYRKSLSKI